jgi:peptidoglycan/LPS O-acetylase OafA/YrhL
MAAEIKPLTSIRGIAAVLVAVYHFHQLQDTGIPTLNHFIRHGYFWVDLFFVLSGFVMALTYAGMFAQGFSWRAHRDFLRKRVARVYPLYLAVTLGVSCYSLLVYGGFEGVKRPAVNLADPVLAHITNLLMVHAWGFGSSIGGPTWSISTEWAAYLLFPLLAWLALFRGKGAAVLLGLAATALLAYVATQPETGQTVRNGQFDIYHCLDGMAVFRCVGGFTIGLLAYRLRQTAWLMQLLRRDSVCFGLFALLLVGMAVPLPDLLLYPLLPLLVLSLYAAQGRALAFFSWAPFYRLGIYSYAIYLLHAHFHVVHGQLEKHLPRFMPETAANLIACIVVYGAVLGAAVFSYHYIEQPGRRWLRQRTAEAE